MANDMVTLIALLSRMSIPFFLLDTIVELD